MREILFRGKRVDNGEWVYGSYFHHKDSDINAHYIINSFGFEDEIDENTLGQFTELTDKNGVKIFEGDIGKNGGLVEFFNSLNWDSGGSVHSGFYCKKWFEFEPTQELSYHYGFDEFEVIGNIHENPELL